MREVGGKGRGEWAREGGGGGGGGGRRKGSGRGDNSERERLTHSMINFLIFFRGFL